MKINEYRIIFVGGIHGVGKSRFIETASRIIEIPSLSASRLITDQRKSPAAIKKRVQNVEENQDALISAIESHPIDGKKFILDGHFSIFDSSDLIRKIPIETFQKLAPAAVVILLDDVDQIQKRLWLRDKRSFQPDLLNKLQQAEREHAENVCRQMEIPLFPARPAEHETAIQFMADCLDP